MQLRLIWLTLQFVTLWLCFMVIIFCIALLTNINWARNRLEALMSDSIHRRVQLGHLSWTLGFNGLSVDTNKLKIYERNDKPFLIAGPSEIGIAFWPLLTGHLKIRHLNFSYPEIWAVRLSPGVWNFDDLWLTTYDVSFLQADHGRINLIDAAPADKFERFKPTILDNFEIKLVQPRKLTRRPFLLSFKIVRPTYCSLIQVNGLEVAKKDGWQNNYSEVKVRTSQFDLDDLKSVALIFNVKAKDLISQIRDREPQGLVNLNLIYKGTLAKHFVADADIIARALSYKDVRLGKVQASNFESKLHLKGNDNTLTWQGCSFKLPGYQITGRSEGKVDNWHSPDDAEISGSAITFIEDLNALDTFFPELRSSPSRLKYMAHAKGKLFIDTTFSGSKNIYKYSSSIRAVGVVAPEAEKLLAASNLPPLPLLGLPTIPAVSGNIVINHDGLIEYKDCLIGNENIAYKAFGYYNSKEEKGELNFSLKDLALKTYAQTINQSPQAKEALREVIDLSKQSRLDLDGNANISGVIKQNKDNIDVQSEVILKDASVNIPSPPLCLTHLNGTLHANNHQLTLKDLASTVEHGKLNITGTLPVIPSGKLDLHLHATDFNLTYISSLLQLFHIDSPFFSGHQLTGYVKELTLNLTGTPAKPILEFVAQPQELCFQPPEVAFPLKATSGIISYANDTLDLQDVGIALHSGQLTASLSVQSLSKNAQLEKLRLKANAADIKELHAYLTSALTPESLREPYIDWIEKNKLTYLHGKVSGDVSVNLSNDKPQIDGTLNLNNVGAKVEEEDKLVDHLAGTIVASGNNLALSGISGTLNGNQFELNGRVQKYLDAIPHCSGEVRANIDSVNLSQLASYLSNELYQSHIKIEASSPLALKAKFDNHDNITSINLNLSADADNRVVLSGLFGILHQPIHEPLSFESNIRIDPQVTKISDIHLKLGPAHFEGNAELKKPAEVDTTTASKNDLEINCRLHTPEYVPCKTISQLVDFDHEATGEMKEEFIVQGKLSEPEITTALSFKRASSPRLNIYDLTGDLNGVVPIKSSKKDRVLAKCNFHSLYYDKVRLENLKSTLVWQADIENRAHAQKMVLDGSALLAGGKFAYTGFVDLNKHKLFLQANIKEANVDNLTEEFPGLKGTVTGLLDADTTLQTSGTTQKELLANLSGTGTITIYNGTASSVSHLQAKINQVNFMRQGLLGFNINNLMQSVAPVKTGYFYKLETALEIEKEHLLIKRLKYDGDDMQLWITGEANLPLHTLELEITGKIPQVSNSMISQTFGGLSRQFTFQKMIDSITLHKLESLPSVPVLGNLSSSKESRVFACHILAPYDQPKLISQSIEKSFRWLPDKSGSSAEQLSNLYKY